MRTRFLLFTAFLVVLMGTFTPNASARPQEGLRITPTETAEADYPAMGPGCPGCSKRAAGGAGAPVEGVDMTPAQCAGQVVHCDTIPIEIVPPTGLEDDRDIFFTIIELHWDGGTGNDLDLFFYDNAQSTGTAEKLGSAESTKNPEQVRVANADLEQYNIVVLNYNGANTGYKIKARISTDPFTSPTEAVAPDPPKPAEPEAEDEAEEEITPPEDLSGGGDVTPIASDPTLPPVTGVTGDSDFGFGFSDLDSRITVEQDDFAAGGADPTPTATETVSPAVLMASLIGAPALVVGSGAAFAWKRRRDLLI